MPEPDQRAAIDEPPPFLGRWRNIYAAVLCYLTVLIVILYEFTRLFGNA